MTYTIPNIADALDPKQAQIDKVDLDIISGGSNNQGVISGCAVSAQSTPDMTVAVASGTASINKATQAAVTAGNLTIGSNTSGNPRFDLITVNSSGTKSVTAGTAAVAPVYPAIPASSAVLAAVFVPSGVSAITNAHIIDKRVVVNDLSGYAQINNVPFRPWWGYPFDGTTTTISDAQPGVSNGVVFNSATYSAVTKIGIPNGSAGDSTGDPVVAFQSWKPGSGHKTELKGNPLGWLYIQRDTAGASGAPGEWSFWTVTGITEHTSPNYWEFDVSFNDAQTAHQQNRIVKLYWIPNDGPGSRSSTYLTQGYDLIGFNQNAIYDEPYEIASGNVTEIWTGGVLSLIANGISGVISGTDAWGGYLEILPD